MPKFVAALSLALLLGACAAPEPGAQDVSSAAQREPTPLSVNCTTPDADPATCQSTEVRPLVRRDEANTLGTGAFRLLARFF